MFVVLELIYWRDVKKTGIVFGSMIFVLLSLTFFTILSVLSYLSLAILTVTMSFRVYRSIMQAVQKTNEGHPFKWVSYKAFYLNLQTKFPNLNVEQVKRLLVPEKITQC